MSDLKYMNTSQLEVEISRITREIGKLKGKIHNLDQRKIWAEKYLFEKTPQELTISQIENALGHAIIIKPE